MAAGEFLLPKVLTGVPMNVYSPSQAGLKGRSVEQRSPREDVSPKMSV